LSPLERSRRIRRRADGRYTIRIPPVERRLLSGIPEALAGTLEAARAGVDDTPELVRLFPPAYTEDHEAERSYRELMHTELFEAHQQALTVLASTAAARELDEEQMSAWMSALNDARLVLGTTLGVSEDHEPLIAGEEDRQRYSLYIYLSILLEEIVEALAGGLPDPPNDSGYAPPEDPWGEPPDGLRWTAPGAPNVLGSGRVPGPPAEFSGGGDPTRSADPAAAE
jgi:hypothetical protein